MELFPVFCLAARMRFYAPTDTREGRFSRQLVEFVEMQAPGVLAVCHI